MRRLLQKGKQHIFTKMSRLTWHTQQKQHVSIGFSCLKALCLERTSGKKCAFVIFCLILSFLLCKSAGVAKLLFFQFSESVDQFVPNHTNSFKSTAQDIK